MKTNAPMPRRYWIPTTLWSVQRPKYRPTPAVSFSRTLGGLPSEPLQRVVGETEADEEADHADEVRDEQRDVVLIRVGEVVDALRVDLMAEPPADVEPDDPEHDSAQEVEADQAAELHPARPVGSGL